MTDGTAQACFVWKKSDTGDILEGIHKLLYANSNKPYPLTPSKIAKAIDYSRYRVYNYIKKLSAKGEMVRTRSGHFLLPKHMNESFASSTRITRLYVIH